MTQLEKLFLQNNEIEELDRHEISPLASLAVLRLDSNRISRLGKALSGLSRLTSLNLSSNRIQQVEVRNCLHYIFLRTRIKYRLKYCLGDKFLLFQFFLYKGFSGLSQLQELWMNRNYIESIDPTSFNAISGSLTELRMSSNRISNLTGFAVLINLQVRTRVNKCDIFVAGILGGSLSLLLVLIAQMNFEFRLVLDLAPKIQPVVNFGDHAQLSLSDRALFSRESN